MCRVVAQCTAPGTGLPFNKPRYVMGIGYPLDIVMCSGDHPPHSLQSCLMRCRVCPEGVGATALLAAIGSCHQAAIEVPYLMRLAEAEARLMTDRQTASCAALGADMYDSVYPSRTARFGVALVSSGVLKLKNICYKDDYR